MPSTQANLTFKSARKDMAMDTPAQSDSVFDDYDFAIKRNLDQQDDLSSHMVGMARSLKLSSLAAHNLIKRDIKKLTEAKEKVEENSDALKHTSERLNACARSSLNWGLIALMVVVFIIFIFMVFLVKVLKKKQ